MARFLLTGFGPFPNCPVNPTGAVINGVRDALAGDLDVVTSVLPVHWGAPPEHLTQLLAKTSDWLGVVALGVGRPDANLAVERVAYNQTQSARPDASGVEMPVAPLIDEAPAKLNGVLHLPPFAQVTSAAQSQGLPVVYSDDAGRYLCNAMFLEVMWRTRTLEGRPRGFIHIPHVLGVSAAEPRSDTLVLADAVETLTFLVRGWVEAEGTPGS